MKPFRQGDLDGLCGVYAVLNSLKVLGYKNSLEDWQAILFEILKQLYHDKQSLHFLLDGITTPDISRILKNKIIPEHEISYTKPFHSKADTHLSDLWDTLFSHLNSKSPRTAILCIEGNDFGHWTVVTSLSNKRLTLFDSDRMQWLNRSQCTTSELTTKMPTLIYPTTLFLLKKS